MSLRKRMCYSHLALTVDSLKIQAVWVRMRASRVPNDGHKAKLSYSPHSVSVDTSWFSILEGNLSDALVRLCCLA